MYYMTTREYVKAWRNDGHLSPPEWTAEYGVKFNPSGLADCKYVMIGWALINEGDWLVVDKDEDLYVYSDEDFKDKYEAVT